MEVERSYANARSMASVLVVGGAGYVGSSVVTHLLDQGEQVWVLDDLSTGHRMLVPESIRSAGRFTESHYGNRPVVEALLRSVKFDVVFHFGAKSIVSESVKYPEMYWENNVSQTRELLDAMVATGTKRLVFSSTASVYGDPGENAVTEELPKNPINPYGKTKLAVEEMLVDYGNRYGFRSIALRYFNAAGADSQARVGEHHDPETHLIPNLLSAALAGRAISIFGDDYSTRDGTCLRDYIHVEDLAVAHASAFRRMASEAIGTGGFEAFNLGSESGFTVKEVISAAERVTGKKIKSVVEPRRAGDPSKLVAVAKRAQQILGFKPRANAMDSILASAYAWERKKNEPKRAVFLDRDGTLNFDPGYISDAEQFEIIPGTERALKKLQDAGFLLVVVSNQSGVARKKVTIDQLNRIHEKLDRLLGAAGVSIYHYALCFHHPDEDCGCRKPKTKLLADASHRYGIELSRSYMVGDKFTDVECGRNAKLAGSFLVGTGHGTDERKYLSSSAGIFFPTLEEVVDAILTQITQ